MRATEQSSPGLALVVVDGNPKPPTTAEQAKQAKREAFMALARSRFHTVVSAEQKLRENMLDDLRFRASEQWDPDAIHDREADDRPYLTINRLPQFIRQVLNAQRAANLSIKVKPVDDSDKDTADIYAGLIRHIEQKSDAQTAYSTASDHQTTIGRGYIKLTAEFLDDPDVWLQELRIKRVRNQFRIYMDPAAEELDGTDSNYAFEVSDLPNDVFDDLYGKEHRQGLNEFASTGDEMSRDWAPTGRTRVAKYWFVETQKEKRVLIVGPDGAELSVTEDEYNAMPDSLRPHVKVKARRTVRKRVVKWAIVCGTGILEGNEDQTDGALWGGKTIPIFPVIGDEIDINGEIDYRGMVRDAKDPQRLYNFQNTALAESLALAPLAQWVGYAGQFSGHEGKWLQANKRRFPYLEANAVDVEGKVVGLPQRITAGPPIAEIVAAIHQHNNDLQATMGLYDPSLGQRNGQQSGKAIQFLQRQGELANSNFMDNLARSLRALGRALVELIPQYYSWPQVVRIVGSDEKERTVMVHAGRGDMVPEQLPEGVEGVFDLSKGRFDVVVDVGPSQPTKRAEALEHLMAFVQAYPNAFPIIGDIILRNMDFTGSDAAAERLKKIVPPNVLEEEAGGEPVPPHVQAKMMEMAQQLEMAMQELGKAKQIIDTKQVESGSKMALEQMKIAADLQIEAIHAKVEAMKVATKADADAGLLELKGQIERLAQITEHAHERAMEAERRAAARQDAAVERQHDRVDAFANRALDRQESHETRQADREDAAIAAARDAQREREKGTEIARRGE